MYNWLQIFNRSAILAWKSKERKEKGHADFVITRSLWWQLLKTQRCKEPLFGPSLVSLSRISAYKTWEELLLQVMSLFFTPRLAVRHISSLYSLLLFLHPIFQTFHSCKIFAFNFRLCLYLKTSQIHITKQVFHLHFDLILFDYNMTAISNTSSTHLMR